MHLRLLRTTLGVLTALSLPTAAAAQLRPLEPLPQSVFEQGSGLSVRTGLGFYQGQRASLAGTEGRLLEVGDFQATWRSGRFAIEIGGTVLRLFDDDSMFATPYGGARPEAGPSRRDAGDYRIATAVHLTPLDRDAGLVLRFGTRLPTTDNEVGLERDRTDFFALVGGHLRRGGFRAAAETGVSINGTRDTRLEQADVMAYSLSTAYQHGWLTPSLALVGQKDYFSGWSMRGNEELAELRAGVRAGRRYWVQAEWVHGLAEFSPRSGLRLGAGIQR